MLVVVGAETLVLALLVVLVAGLLRSHARILQALHSLGVDLESSSGSRPQPTTAGATPIALRLPKLSMNRPPGGPAFNITGQAATGESVSIAVLGSRVDTLIAFLSTGCTTCAGFWDALRAGAGTELADRTRLVVVTRGAGEESPARLRNLAPPDVPVILSSEAWDDYAVPGSPYFVYVHGPEAAIAGEGSAATWADVVSLFQDALANAPDDGGRRRAGKAQADAEREARTDRALQAAGILPGDPRLHPPATTADDRS